MTIFLDNNATTAIEPEVLAAMMKGLGTEPLNPSSVTQLGRKAKLMLLEARKTCAKHLSCIPQEIIFTSGATEANNLAIYSMAKRFNGTIVTSPIEHPSILEPLEFLESQGRHVHYLSIDERGHVDPSELESLANIAFVALGAANSETGIMNPIETISSIALARPRIAGRFSVPARRPFSCEPPRICARG